MARKISMGQFRGEAKLNLSEHEAAERYKRIRTGSQHGAQVTKAFAAFAKSHAEEFEKEMGIHLNVPTDTE